MSHRKPQFETITVYPTDRRGMPVFEENPDQPGSMKRVSHEMLVPLDYEQAPVTRPQAAAIGRSAVRGSRPVLVREHYRNLKGHSAPVPETPKHTYQPRVERRHRRTRAEMDSMWTGSSWKAKIKRTGAIALSALIIGFVGKDPAVAFVNQKVNDAKMAYEQNVVQPTNEFIQDTAEAYDENVVQPINNFKVETGKKIEAAKESVVTLGGLIGEQETISPLADNQPEGNSEKSLESVEPAVEEKQEVSAKTDAENRNPAATSKEAAGKNQDTKVAEAVKSDPEIPPFKYQEAIDKAVEETGTTHKEFHLLRLSENGGENLLAVNHNPNGTIDVSLFQDNVKPTDKEEIQRLQSDPYYAAWKAGMKLKNRREWLKDQNLALAAYNLGPSGAVSNPEGALSRVKDIYEKAGMEMPETDFTRNPYEFMEKHWEDLKSAGLHIPDKPPAAPKTANAKI